MQQKMKERTEMNKKELRNMKLLEATDELIKLAKEDVPVRDKGYYTEQLIYQRGLYLRAEVENNILKVAFYLAEYLSRDCRKPVYTLYIDKKNDVFKGYDYRTKKWSDSMLDKTIFSKWLYQENSYMKEADTALIQKYLESEYDDAFYALYVYQREQRHRRLGMKYEKILTSWDQCMDRLPKIPKDWLRWQKKVGITQNFIFYHYSRRKDQTGYCSWCESEVPISHPHHNTVGHCPKCRHQIQYKALGRAKNIETQKETAYLLQTCGNNVFVLREFQLQMLIVSSSYKKPVYSFFERRRILYDEELNTKEYYFGRHHWTKENRWISHMEGCMPKEVTKKEEIPENQVMSKERHRAKEAFFYEGNKYISLGQCCEFYGINESSVRSRAWRKKCTWEEAVKYYIQKKETETPKMQFFYKGKRYKSVSACCAEYGVNASSVRNRAKTTECSIEESLDHFIKKARMETQPSVFIFRDKTYRSLEECCLEYGVNADSVSSRKYRLNCTMEESLEHFIENKDMIAERIQKFTFKGIEYRSLRACCQKYGIDDICVRQRARDKNCSLEESFTHFMTRKRKKMLSNPEFEYHGTVYPSLKVCCEELGINKSSVISRSHRTGCSLQEAVEYYVSQQERRTLD